MTTGEFAPAKVNLYLHVGPPGSDGYHPLESWMVFADVGDRVFLQPSETLAFEVVGAFAGEIPSGPDNLAVRARDAVLAQHPRDPFKLTLEKVLPPASGIGGGSSDAAAVLRLLGHLSPQTALMLGADVPACLRAQSLIAKGRGEVLEAGPKAPPLPAVLVNPRVGVSTGAVFKRYDVGAPKSLKAVSAPDFGSVAEVATFLKTTRNDLEAPALALEPMIGEVLESLAGPEALFARMSGSGATCFALCPSGEAAQSLAGRIARHHPAWWVRASTLS